MCSSSCQKKHQERRVKAAPRREKTPSSEVNNTPERHYRQPPLPCAWGRPRVLRTGEASPGPKPNLARSPSLGRCPRRRHCTSLFGKSPPFPPPPPSRLRRDSGVPAIFREIRPPPCAMRHAPDLLSSTASLPLHDPEENNFGLLWHLWKDSPASPIPVALFYFLIASPSSTKYPFGCTL